MTGGNGYLKLVQQILRLDIQTDETGAEYIDEQSLNPFGEPVQSWRYRDENGKLMVNAVGDTVKEELPFRRFLWNRLHLKRVCDRYRESYEQWKTANKGIKYICSGVIDDGKDEPNPQKMETDAFIQAVFQREQSGLHLLMAEYGMGKTSFCAYLRSKAAKLMENYPNDPQQSLSFPLVFNLNEYRDQDFDRFIETHLYSDYGISMSFDTLKELCRGGYFCLVLDAWDQMHGTPNRLGTLQDIRQFSRIWEDCGAMLITCRRSFYTKQLSIRGIEENSTISKAQLYTLCGFDKQAAKQYLEYVRDSRPAALPSLEQWFDEAWQINTPLLKRPLTLQLLADYYDPIWTDGVDLGKTKLDDFRLFQIVLDCWIEDQGQSSSEELDAALKVAVWCTLSSGLNRRIPLKTYRDGLGLRNNDSKFEDLRERLKTLDFFSIQDDDDPEKGTIEFRLAAYQEFLWARYVVKELEKGKLCDESCLLNRYLLNPETRVWVAQAFSAEESPCLKTQLSLVAYKNKEDTGWSGGNALTVLGDLLRLKNKFYTDQFGQLSFTDRSLRGADLHGLDLRGLQFARSDLREADLSYTRLDGASFQGARLSDVIWDEYGRMHSCAFFRPADNSTSGSVAAALENGVLTFSMMNPANVQKNSSNASAYSASDDIIRSLAADSAGVYTAGKNGRVGYLDQNGLLQNAYIAEGGLRSITAGAAGAVYVSAEEKGLYRYNWKSGERTEIKVLNKQGEPVSCGQLEDIHYHREGDEEFIVYLTADRRTMVLLELRSEGRAEIIGTGSLSDTRLTFGDICFAGAYLAYSVEKRGVFAFSRNFFFGSLSGSQLLKTERLLCPAEQSVLAWAEEKKLLLVMQRESGSILSLSPDGAGSPVRYELDWNNHKPSACEEMEGFCCSPDGAVIAVTGERLAVFSRAEGDDSYGIIGAPLEANISCEGAIFRGCEGLSDSWRRELQGRGAEAP